MCTFVDLLTVVFPLLCASAIEIIKNDSNSRNEIFFMIKKLRFKATEMNLNKQLLRKQNYFTSSMVPL